MNRSNTSGTEDPDPSGLPTIHPQATCPKCNVSFRFEAVLGADITMIQCPHCECGLVAELFLGKVVKLEPFEESPESLYAVLGRMASRARDANRQQELAQEHAQGMDFRIQLEKAWNLIGLNRLEEALELLMALHKVPRSEEQRAALELHLGNVYMRMERREDAASYYEMAITRARAAQFPRRSPGAGLESLQMSSENARNLDTEAAALGNLGFLHAQGGDFVKAQESLENSLQIYRRLKSKRGQANQQYMLGQVYVFRGNVSAGLALLRSAQDLFRELNDQEHARQCQDALRRFDQLL